MALDMFLKIAGLPGESRDKTHAGEIDVLTWAWSVSNSSSAQVGGGAGSGKCNVSDLSFTMYASKASPLLALHCCTGKHIAEAVLTVRKAGDQPLDYLVIKLKDLIVTSYQTGAAANGDPRIMEGGSISFGQYEVKYTEQTAKGGAGDQCEAAYDVAANTNL